MKDSKTMTKKEVAAFLGVSKTTVTRLVKDGTLRQTKLRPVRNSTCFFDREEVQNLKN
jgi:excisionase family DNA binding protein